MQQTPPTPPARPQAAPTELASSQLAGMIAAPPARPTVVPMLPTRVRQPGRQAPLPDPVAIRRLAVPDGAPPYDDELGATRPQSPANSANNETHDGNVTNPPVPATRTAAADTREPGKPRQPDETRQPGKPSQRAEPSRPDEPGHRGPDQRGPVQRSPDQRGGSHRPGGRSELPGNDVWPSQFAQVLAETLAGSRPTQQLTPWTSEQARRRIRELGPLLATDQRPRVRRLLTSAPASDVLELTAVVGFGSRIRALAVRLEREEAPLPGRNGSRWRCTAVESG
jgi:hypothetical protein